MIGWETGYFQWTTAPTSDIANSAIEYDDPVYNNYSTLINLHHDKISHSYFSFYPDK